MLFIYHSPESKEGRVTIIAKESPEGVSFYASRCSPNDTWCRSTGRNLALERMHAGKKLDFFPIIGITPRAFRYIAEGLAIEVLMNMSLVNGKK